MNAASVQPEMKREETIRSEAASIRSQLPTISSTPGQRVEFNVALGKVTDSLQRQFVNFDRAAFLDRVGGKRCR